MEQILLAAFLLVIALAGIVQAARDNTYHHVAEKLYAPPRITRPAAQERHAENLPPLMSPLIMIEGGKMEGGKRERAERSEKAEPARRAA